MNEKLLQAFIALFIFLSMFNINLSYRTIDKLTGRRGYNRIDLHFIFSGIVMLLFFYYTHTF